jgi:hypothetical protein
MSIQRVNLSLLLRQLASLGLTPRPQLCRRRFLGLSSSF